MGPLLQLTNNSLLDDLLGEKHLCLSRLIMTGMAIGVAVWFPVVVRANDLNRPDPLLQQMIIPLNSGTQSVARNQADLLLQLGQDQLKVGALTEAIRFWEKAVQLYRQVGDTQAEGVTLSYLGSTYQQLGRIVEAEDAFRGQLAAARDTRNLLMQITASNRLARLLIQANNPGAAASLLDNALVLANQINSRAGQAVTYTSLGILNTRLGQLEVAIRQYQEALRAGRQANDTVSEATARNGIGDIYLALRRYPTAIDSYSQALTLARINQDLFNQTYAIDGMVAALNKTEQKQAIPPLLNERLLLAQQSQNPQQEIATLTQMARFYQQQGNYSQAERLFQQAIAVAQRAQDSQQEIQLIERLTSFRRNPSAW